MTAVTNITNATNVANVTRRLRIEGHVQGVGFRWSFMEQVRQLKLDGWVRNRADGSVEAQISGPAKAVNTLTAWAHFGPPRARVDRVDYQDDQLVPQPTSSGEGGA